MDLKPPLIFVGNLDSLLFRQRLELLSNLLSSNPTRMVINTRRRSYRDQARFMLLCFCLILKTYLCFRRTRLILHGAYSPVLWLLLLLPSVQTVSILQGSELNVDFTGIRSRLITLILRRSVLVAFRNESQRQQAVQLCGVRPESCVIVHWGMSEMLFEKPLVHKANEPVLISPRATQPEYNIPIIFEVITRLKKEGHRLRFIYVRFNPKFEIEDTSAADEILDSPDQEYLWERISGADLCITVPDYDGLSNTVLEALALGSLPVFSDLPPYGFLKQDERLGIPVGLGISAKSNADNLYFAIKEALTQIKAIRGDASFRRDFVERNYKIGSGIERMVEVLRA